jgi:hypothetical protein
MNKVILSIVIIAGATNSLMAGTLEEIWARQAFIDKFVREAPVFIVDNSLQALRTIGLLKKETVKEVPNPHIPDKLEEFRTLTFDGLVLYGHMRSPEELSPIKITVTGTRWNILHDLNVGTPADGIEEILGPPTEKSDDLIIYRGETERVKFYIKGDTIKKIELIYYAD